MKKFLIPFLFVMLVTALLMGYAMPALADDGDVVMWVQRNRIAYTGRSSGGPDSMVGYVHVRDTNLTMVVGANVAAIWTLPDGTTRQQYAVTQFQGIAEFRLWAGRGTYQLCVLDVTKPGWVYEPSRNRETCAVFNLP